MKINKMKSALLLTVLIVTGTGFNACNNNKNNEEDFSQQDQSFARDVSASNIAEIQFGQMAVQKSTNDSVLAFARKMIDDHTVVQKSLDSLAKNLNLVLSDSMNSTHKSLYKSISGLNNSAFDMEYMRSQVNDHQAAQTLLQDEISKGTNEKLIRFATKNLPAIKAHLEKASSISTYLNGLPGQP